MNASAGPPPELLAGIAQFNAGAFFECHETLEAIWLAEPGAIRRLYQGILQVGVAFYHQRNNNFRGCTSLLETGLAYLRPFAPVCLGVNVEQLIEDASRCQAVLLGLGKERLQEFDRRLIPHIHLTGEP
ncbi:MAG: DUF309 domain-containing protein [Chloroflexota bacterium]